MCHHEVPTTRLKERNIYSDELCITIALLSSTQWSEQDMASRVIHHQDSIQHRQKLFGAGLQHTWTTPMGYKVPDWSANPA